MFLLPCTLCIYGVLLLFYQRINQSMTFIIYAVGNYYLHVMLCGWKKSHISRLLIQPVQFKDN